MFHKHMMYITVKNIISKIYYNKFNNFNSYGLRVKHIISKRYHNQFNNFNSYAETFHHGHFHFHCNVLKCKNIQTLFRRTLIACSYELRRCCSHVQLIVPEKQSVMWERNSCLLQWVMWEKMFFSYRSTK